MTVNLHARTDFGKGDIGRLAGHTALRMDSIGKGQDYVVALQDVKAGTNGWFEKKVA
jgi:hypothetical protein